LGGCDTGPQCSTHSLKTLLGPQALCPISLQDAGRVALCRHAVLRDGDAQDVLQPIMSRGSGVLMPVSPATQEAGTLAEPTLAPASPQPAQRVEPSALMPELECAVPAPRACSAPAAHPTVKAEARRVPTGFGACTAGWEPEAACADVPEPETPPSALEAVPRARAAASLVLAPGNFGGFHVVGAH